MAARAYSCARCGAAVEEQARRCGYCGAPVATVRCAGCFHMNVPDALHCAGCGETLGLEPIAEPGDLRCAGCAAQLSAFRGGSGVLYDCAQCGGQFVEH